MNPGFLKSLFQAGYFFLPLETEVLLTLLVAEEEVELLPTDELDPLDTDEELFLLPLV